MGNPYGITEVDIGGLLGAYQSTRNNRLNTLLTERQVAREDRALERESKIADAFSNFISRTAPQGGVGGAYAAPSDVAPSEPYDPWQDEEAQAELIRTLGALDPSQAMSLRNQFRQYNADERKVVADSYKQLGNVAFSLRQLPADQRAGELQRMAPMLNKLGITAEMLQGVDMSDRGLETLVNQFRDIEKVISGQTPDRIPVQAGGTVYEADAPSPYPNFAGGGNGDPPPTAVQPLTVEMVQGALNSLGPQGTAEWLQRNNHVVSVATPAEASRLPPGTRILLPDGSEGRVP